MSVTVAKSAGFCFGVNRAVELVEQAAAQGGTVVTLGPIIHNRHAVAHFEAMGVHVIDTPEEAPEGATVVIRSHGVGREVYRRLENRNVTIVDATCPFVKRIHNIVAQAEGSCLSSSGRPPTRRWRASPGGAAAAPSLKARKNWEIGSKTNEFPRTCRFAWFLRPPPQNLCGKNASKSEKKSLLT